MNKYIKAIIKSILFGVMFAIGAFIISVIMGTEIIIVNIAGRAVVYSVIMFLLYIIAPPLRKILGFK